MIESTSEFREMMSKVFVQAASDGVIDKVTNLWDFGSVTDIDCRDSRVGRTALHGAAMRGHIDVAKFLLERGASTESRTHQSITPLHFAVSEGNVEMTDLLCRFGADVNAAGLKERTPLHFALEKNLTHIMAYLLNHPSIDLLRQDDDGRTVLFQACLKGDETFATRVVEKLNEVGATDTKRALVNMPRRDKSTPLIAAAYFGHISLVAFLIDHGADLEAKTASGYSPLNSAACMGHSEVVQFLLAKGADVETSNLEKYTPLICAAIRGHIDVAKFLLERGASTESRTHKSITPLHFAVSEGNVEMTDLLCRFGADVNVAGLNGSTPLHFALEKNLTHVMTYLLNHPSIDLLRQDDDGETVLYQACCKGDETFATRVVEKLNEVGATDTKRALMNMPRHNKWTPLHAAAYFGHISLVAFLIDHGADLETKTASGYSPLYTAAEWGHSRVVQFLLAKGADVETSNLEKYTPLICAAIEGHIDVAKSLLERGASTESRTHQSLTPLHIAVIQGNVEMVDLLCRFGADVNAAGLNGRTPLHFALEKNLTHVMTYLLNHPSINLLRQDDDGETVLYQACCKGDETFATRVVEKLNEVGATDTKRALVNMPRHNKWTPLHTAAYLGHISLVAFLIDHGADLETKTASGYSPLNSAAERGHSRVVRFLLAKGADVETSNLEKATPLICASYQGYESIVEMLLEHGAKVNHKNNRGYSALTCAAGDGHAGIVKSLLNRGADAEIRTIDGWTPLLFAAENEDVQVVQLLIDHGADTNCQSDGQFTPLIVAARRGHTVICLLLLLQGASTTLQMADGQTALHAAATYDHQEIIGLLLSAGADPKVRDFDGRTAAYMAMLAGHFATADLLDPTDPTDPTGAMETENDDEIWPQHSLRELYGVATTNKQEVKTLRQNPRWYIDRSSIDLIKPRLRLMFGANVSVGTWLGSQVKIVETNIASRLAQQRFREELEKIYPLRHPHVIKLYGACHRGEKPFLVLEYGQDNGTFQSYAEKNNHRVWAILHEISLGVQYLHERGIVHGRPMADNMSVGDDGFVKISAFGLYSGDVNEKILGSDAPEVLSGTMPTFASDVYTLGMCIFQVVSGKSPYSSEIAEKKDVKELIGGGVPPKRHAAISDRGWELVMQMISFHPRKRLKISDVVDELAALAQDEALEARGLMIDRNGFDFARNDSFDIEKTFTLALSLLSISGHESGDNNRDIETPQSQVFYRLYEAWQASKNLPLTGLELVQLRLQDILTRFTNDLQAQASMGLAASFAADRQHADRIHSFHNEIDRLLDQHNKLLEMPTISTTHTTTDIHSWHDRWHAYRRSQLQAFGASLEGVEELDVETSTCLLFELTKHRDAYTSIPPFVIQTACSKMRSMPGVRVPDWFIPHYEVKFDAFQSFSRGAFGSVHHGEWMGSRAVIKKVFADKDEKDDVKFQKEADIWSRLYHPHVLQLFGACHVGQKFLISEYAADGQLDHYLHKLEKTPTRRKREVWRTLHEAALGLQYLHSCGVVHCDLKCNNILIGRDNKAKVSDYGLSRSQEQYPKPASVTTSNTNEILDSEVIESTPKGVGAPRWKAPEVLNGGEPTIESDVYSFGMCVVEAVTGDYPWGRDRDELVSDHVRRGGALFTKPREFSDAQWSLVVGACRFDPTERLQLTEIVAQLETFANDASQTETEATGDATSSKLEGLAESEPEMNNTTMWSDSTAFSDLALPAALNNLSIGLNDGGASTQDTSYSGSW